MTRPAVRQPVLWFASHAGPSKVCLLCGRPLSDPTSVALGIGPVCSGRVLAPSKEALMPESEDVNPVAARLGEHVNRPLPEGVSSKVYRVRAPVEVHERLSACRSPAEIGNLLAELMGVSVD